MTNNSQKGFVLHQAMRGFAIPSIIAVVILIVMVGGVFAVKNSYALVGDDAMIKKDGEMMQKKDGMTQKDSMKDGSMIKNKKTKKKPTYKTMKKDSMKDGTMTKDKTMMKKDSMKKDSMKDGSMIKKDGTMMQKDSMKDGSMMKKDGTMMQKPSGAEAMEGKKDGMTKDGEMMMKMKKGSYEVYGQDKVSAASSEKNVVLFFRASWCPTCRALDADIRANLDKIPAKVTILDVDYDTYTDLKQKYGVTYQHTLIQVDASGNQIAKWSGSPTLASLLTNIK